MKNNIIRSASVYEDYGLTDNDLYLECHKSIYNSEADCAKLGPDTHAGTWNNPGYYWTDHYMVFCPGFFTSPRMSDDIAKAKDGTYDTRTIDNFQRSKGATFFHESFHLDYTVGKPPSKYCSLACIFYP
jgi:hypothetical protein